MHFWRCNQRIVGKRTRKQPCFGYFSGRLFGRKSWRNGSRTIGRSSTICRRYIHFWILLQRRDSLQWEESVVRQKHASCRKSSSIRFRNLYICGTRKEKVRRFHTKYHTNEYARFDMPDTCSYITNNRWKN